MGGDPYGTISVSLVAVAAVAGALRIEVWVPLASVTDASYCCGARAVMIPGTGLLSKYSKYFAAFFMENFCQIRWKYPLCKFLKSIIFVSTMVKYCFCYASLC